MQVTRRVPDETDSTPSSEVHTPQTRHSPAESNTTGADAPAAYEQAKTPFVNTETTPPCLPDGTPDSRMLDPRRSRTSSAPAKTSVDSHATTRFVDTSPSKHTSTTVSAAAESGTSANQESPPLDLAGSPPTDTSQGNTASPSTKAGDTREANEPTGDEFLRRTTSSKSTPASLFTTRPTTSARALKSGLHHSTVTQCPPTGNTGV